MSTAIDKTSTSTTPPTEGGVFSTLFKKTTPEEREARKQQKQDAKKAKKAKRSYRRDDRRLDYRYAEDNPFLFIKGNSVWTGVILSTTSDEFATYTEDEQQTALQTDIWVALSQHFANHWNEPEVTFHLVTRYFPVDVSNWERQYIDHCWDPSKLFTDLLHKKVSPHLADSTPERRQYLLIRIGDFEASTKPDPLSALLGETAGVAEEVFNSHDLAPLRDRARSIHDVMHRTGAVPMDRVDLAWLIRKTLSGHFPVDTNRTIERTRPWRGGYFDEIVNSTIDNHGNCVRIHNPRPEDGGAEYSYTTTVTMTYKDPYVPYRHSQAWGKVLRGSARPVDVSWRGKIISAEEWKRRAKKIIRSFEEEGDDRRQAGASQSASFDQKEQLAVDLKLEQEEHARPLLISQQRLTLSAPTEEELTNIVGALQRDFGESVVLERTRGAQGLLLEEQLPGDMTPPRVTFAGLGINMASRVTMDPDTGGINDGARYTDLEALSYARLDSSPTVGDEIEYTSRGIGLGWRGCAIGYAAANGAVVHFDPIVQMARNSGAGTIIIGSSGGGKSSLALTLFFWCSEAGTQSIVLDPKNDFERFCYYLSFGSQVNDDRFFKAVRDGTLNSPDSPFQPVNPQFWEDTQIIDLGYGAPGMLDPWAITDSYHEGENVARDILGLVFKKEADHERLEIAFTAMRKRFENSTEKPTLADLASFLGEEIEMYESVVEGDESGGSAKMDAHERGNRLRSVHNSLLRAGERQYGRLMFGRRGEHTEPFTIGNKRRVVITMFGLEKPGEDTPVEEWSEDMSDGAATIMTVIRQLNRLFSGSDEEMSPNTRRRGLRPRLLFIDEAYVVAAFKAGRTMLNVFLRQGRSRNFGVVFISQQAKDLNELNSGGGSDDEEASTNQFPTKFVFRQGGLAEAKDAMKLLRPSLMDNPGELSDKSRLLLKPQDGGVMATGTCVMSDLDGRVSLVKVDRMFNELVAAAETNAQIRSQVQEGELSADAADWTVDTSLRDSLRTGITFAEQREIRETLRQDDEYGEYAEFVDV